MKYKKIAAVFMAALLFILAPQSIAAGEYDTVIVEEQEDTGNTADDNDLTDGAPDNEETPIQDEENAEPYDPENTGSASDIKDDSEIIQPESEPEEQTAAAAAGTVTLPVPEITGAVNDDGGITVTFTQVSDVSGYALYRSENGTDYERITRVKSSKNSYTDKNADTEGQIYYYRVRSYIKDDNGKYHYSSYSEPFTAVRLEKTEIISCRNSTGNGIFLKWQKTAGADGYTIYRSENGGNYEMVYQTSKASWTDSSAVNGALYTYWVEAYKEIDGKTYTAQMSDKYSIYALNRSKVKAFETGYGCIKVKWNKNSSSDGYVVTYQSGSSKKNIVIRSKDTTSTVIKGLQTGGSSYKIYVRSFKKLDGRTILSAYSKAKEVVLSENIISVKDRSDGKESIFRVYLKNACSPDKRTISYIKAAAWSEEDGQDDVIWYKTKKTQAGTYYADIPVSAHKSAGQYYIHLYAFFTDGSSAFLGGTNGMYVHSPSGTFSYENEKLGYISLYFSDAEVCSPIKNLQAEIWSEKGGQDDLESLTFSCNKGVYSAKTNVADHLFQAGTYGVCLYAVLTNGAKACIGNYTIEVEYIPDDPVQYGDGFNYLAIGNSITVHGACSYWWNECGMAASDAKHDYFHLVLKQLKKTYGSDTVGYATNLAYWERAEGFRDEVLKMLDGLLSDKLDLVTIMLGENVGSLDTLEEDYTALIRYIQERAPNAKIIVVGDFWYMEGRDEIKQAVAAGCGAEYAYLGTMITEGSSSRYCAGMGTAVYDPDGNVHYIDNEGVAIHPGDYGMKYIARRILAHI